MPVVNNMDEITIILFGGAILGLVMQYRIRAQPIYWLSLILSAGATFSILDDLGAGNIGASGALFAIIGMLAVFLFSITNYIEARK